MREESPVRYDPEREVWDVFRYDDIKTVLDDDETFSANPRNGLDLDQNEGIVNETMLHQDPPRHDELRDVVEDAFRPSAVKDHEPRIRELAVNLLDGVFADDSQEADIVNALAYPLPILVVAELLGVPEEKHEEFQEWVRVFVADGGGGVPLERQQDVQQEMMQYLSDLLADRRVDPQDDLLSHIATATLDDGSQLSPREVLGMCILLLVAGGITTTLITNTLWCLDNQGSLEELADTDRALTTAIEEVVRYRPPEHEVTRIAMADTTIGGKSIEEGDQVALWLASGNRDKRHFDKPEEFVPDRTPNQHLSFGHGTHYCLGAPLARLETKVAISELLDRLDTIEFGQTSLQPSRCGVNMESLPVQF